MKMKLKRSEIVHALTVVFTLLGGALAYADQIQAVGIIPPRLAQWWPIVLAGASALRGIVRIAADYLDDWQLNDSVR